MMNKDVHYHTIPTHLTWERVGPEVGPEVVILDTTTSHTYRLGGDQAAVFLAVASETPPSAKEPRTPGHAEAITQLEALGLVTPPPGLKRRTVVTGMAAGGLATLLLPQAAAAASGSTLPVTTFTFDQAHADFRWSHTGTTLMVFVSGVGLKETDRFSPGDMWTMTLLNAGNKSATSPVVDAAGLTLTFAFPDTAAGSFPVSLTAQLSRNTGVEILQSQEFTIIEL